MYGWLGHPKGAELAAKHCGQNEWRHFTRLRQPRAACCKASFPKICSPTPPVLRRCPARSCPWQRHPLPQPLAPPPALSAGRHVAAQPVPPGAWPPTRPTWPARPLEWSPAAPRWSAAVGQSLQGTVVTRRVWAAECAAVAVVAGYLGVTLVPGGSSITSQTSHLVVAELARAAASSPLGALGPRPTEAVAPSPALSA